MAGISTESSRLDEQDNEVEALRCIFQDEIDYVLSEKGSKYTKQICIKPNNIGMSFCFSFTDRYPDSPPRIDLTMERAGLCDDQLGELLEHMYEVARGMTGTVMVLSLIDAAKDKLDQMNFDYQRPSDDEPDAKENAEPDAKAICSFFQTGRCRFGTKCLNLHPGDKEFKGSSDSNVKSEASEVKVQSMDEETASGKKPPMKTACDVISRIQWDHQLSPSHFVVGYLDRFLGILEQPFDAFSWVDIATVDLNTLAIPRHRIQYFKYQDEVVWDKRIRLDNVFGSTGSRMTIADVVKKFHKESAAEEEKEVDNTELDDGEQETINKPQNKSTKKINRNVPNYFIAIRIDDEEIKKNVKIVQDSMISDEGALESACTTLSSLHVTLCMLRLDTSEEKVTALRVLKELQRDVSRLLPPSLLLRFQGLNEFHDRILFSPPCEEPALNRFIKHLQTKFREAGISLVGTRETTNPHMTILKLRRADMDELGMRYLDKGYYIQFVDTYFGIQSVNNIHLCSIDKAFRFDGFYDCLASVNLYDECIL